MTTMRALDDASGVGSGQSTNEPNAQHSVGTNQLASHVELLLHTRTCQKSRNPTLSCSNGCVPFLTISGPSVSRRCDLIHR